MAASSFEDVEIEIKLSRSSNDELYISHGCSIRETTTSSGKKYIYRGLIDTNLINGNTCLLTINFIEKTTNELGQLCCRIKGNVPFRIVKMSSRIGLNTPSSFDDVPVTNHCLDDEEYENAFLKDQKLKVIDKISGSITIKKYFMVDDATFKKSFTTNDIIYSQYIYPWRTSQIERLGPGGYLIPEIESYHVPTFRFVSGTALPFSYALYWQSRYFNDFEHDNVRCKQFVDVIVKMVLNTLTN